MKTMSSTLKTYPNRSRLKMLGILSAGAASGACMADSVYSDEEILNPASCPEGTEWQGGGAGCVAVEEDEGIPEDSF